MNSVIGWLKQQSCRNGQNAPVCELQACKGALVILYIVFSAVAGLTLILMAAVYTINKVLDHAEDMANLPETVQNPGVITPLCETDAGSRLGRSTWNRGVYGPTG